MRAGSGSAPARQARSRPRHQPSNTAGSQQSSARRRSAESRAGARSGRPRLEPPRTAAPAHRPPALPRSRRRRQRACPPTAYSSRLSACLRARSCAAAMHAWVRAVWRAPDRCSRAAEAAACRHWTSCSPGNRLGRWHCQWPPSLSGGALAMRCTKLRRRARCRLCSWQALAHCASASWLDEYGSQQCTTLFLFTSTRLQNQRHGPLRIQTTTGRQNRATNKAIRLYRIRPLYTSLVRRQVQGTRPCKLHGGLHALLHSSARAAAPPSGAWAASHRASARCRRHASSGKGLQVCGGRIAWAHARAAARSSCCVSHMRTACAAPRPRVGASSCTAWPGAAAPLRREAAFARHAHAYKRTRLARCARPATRSPRHTHTPRQRRPHAHGTPNLAGCGWSGCVWLVGRSAVPEHTRLIG